MSELHGEIPHIDTFSPVILTHMNARIPYILQTRSAGIAVQCETARSHVPATGTSARQTAETSGGLPPEIAASQSAAGSLLQGPQSGSETHTQQWHLWVSELL